MRPHGPKRRIRSEIFPLALVAGLAFWAYSALPRELFTGEMSVAASSPAAEGCAFVELDPAEASRLIKAATASWQLGGDRVGRMRLDLLSLPADAGTSAPMLPLSERATPDLGNAAAFSPEMPKATLAAPPMAPMKAAAEPAAVSAFPAFPREELLKLD